MLIQLVTVLLFCAVLVTCVVLDISTVYALIAGLLIFIIYGLYRKFSFRELLKMCFSGIRSVRNILIMFVLIGLMTSLWRSSGCIPSIICYTSGLITPSVMVFLCFVLCALISVLTGTAFGTAATMGVICMSMAVSMGIPVFWAGGAILSGSFFGDRCSPVSTSALLVSEITGTDIYVNIRNMIRTSVVPLILSCAVYLVAGLFIDIGDGVNDIVPLFRNEFIISPVCVIPALCIIIPVLFRLNVKITMCISIVAAFIISVFYQGNEISDVLLSLVYGFVPSDQSLVFLIGGGGLLSMVKVSLIVLIASCYSGIFSKTGLLDFLKKGIDRLSSVTTTDTSSLAVAVLAAVVGCNQSLTILLTDQITAGLEYEKNDRAVMLENTAVVIAPLIPWSIACATPLSSVGAPSFSVLFAVYLWLLPVTHVLKSFIKKNKMKRSVIGG